MKILLIGSIKSWTIDVIYKRELSKVNNVDVFPAHDLFLDYYQNSVFNKIKYRLNVSSILNKINKQLLSSVAKEKPDLILVFKGMEIFPKTLRKLKEMGVLLVNYNADDPFDYAFRGSGNSNVKEGLKYYDHHFSYSLRIVKRFNEDYELSSSWLPFAYRDLIEPEPDVKKPTTLCFIGNPDQHRIEIINYLVRSGIMVDVYGHGWDKVLEESTFLHFYPPVYADRFNETARLYYCQLNLFREQNKGSHNMRTFEMPAIGCVLFAPISEEHERLFKNEKEAFFYKNKEDLLRQLNHFFSLEEAQRKEIANAAYRRSLNSSYSYLDRSNEVLQVFESIILTP